jgi:hypothetical protein
MHVRMRGVKSRYEAVGNGSERDVTVKVMIKSAE